jgi:hypothetical protein
MPRMPRKTRGYYGSNKAKKITIITISAHIFSYIENLYNITLFSSTKHNSSGGFDIIRDFFID